MSYDHDAVLAITCDRQICAVLERRQQAAAFEARLEKIRADGRTRH